MAIKGKKKEILRSRLRSEQEQQSNPPLYGGTGRGLHGGNNLQGVFGIVSGAEKTDHPSLAVSISLIESAATCRQRPPQCSMIACISTIILAVLYQQLNELFRRLRTMKKRRFEGCLTKFVGHAVGINCDEPSYKDLCNIHSNLIDQICGI